jgi:putative acetyltransferase
MLISGVDGGLRSACPGDLDVLCSIHRSAVLGLCSGFYGTEKQASWIKAFAGTIPEVFREEEICLLLAEHQGTGAGFGLLKENVICAVYVRPEFAGLGIGRQIVEELESRISAVEHDCICLSASLNAVGFYERLGYVYEKETEMRLPDGQVLACVDMKKEMGREDV